MYCSDGASYNDLQRIIEKDILNIDAQMFINYVWHFIEEHMGDKAVKNQLKYLRYANIPRDTKAKEWILRAQAINSLSPHMAIRAQRLTDEELRDEVIEPNFPSYLRHKMELLVDQTDSLFWFFFPFTCGNNALNSVNVSNECCRSTSNRCNCFSAVSLRSGISYFASKIATALSVSLE